jgi:hypothetical protein
LVGDDHVASVSRRQKRASGFRDVPFQPAGDPAAVSQVSANGGVRQIDNGADDGISRTRVCPPAQCSGEPDERRLERSVHHGQAGPKVVAGIGIEQVVAANHEKEPHVVRLIAGEPSRLPKR